MQDSPHYYSELAPFDAAFRRGFPILTYHKLGPRPRGARLKGMYVGEGLFNRQLSGLTDAGYRSVSLDDFGRPPDQKQPTIVLTFDDGYRSVWKHGLEPMARHRISAITYLVADRIGGQSTWQSSSGEVLESLMNETQVREWLAAGHQIGSHTLTHPRLTQLSPAQAREEISASRKKLEDRFGVPVRHFCYPYGDWNPAVRDCVAESGYATACTTGTGINAADTDPFGLLRVTARYRSRSLKNLWVSVRRFVLAR